MPRKSTTFIPVTTGPGYIPLADIPQDVKDFVEESYAQQRKTEGRTRVEYDTEDELKAEFRQMVSYAAQRPAGVLTIRRSPTRGLAENVMDFRITADLEKNGQKNAKK